jgi:hypothetical protein
MSVIDEILWMLSDGNWHDLKELGENVAMSNFKVEIAVNFLGQYHFIQQKAKIKRIRLQPSILEFMKKIQRIEKEEISNH